MKILVHSVGEQQSEASPSDAVVNSVVMDGAAVLHQALAGETFLEKERRLSEMIRQLQMLREQLLSQQELQTKVGAAAHSLYAYEGLVLCLHSPHTSPWQAETEPEHFDRKSRRAIPPPLLYPY
jgi:hypothetical protein